MVYAMYNMGNLPNIESSQQQRKKKELKKKKDDKRQERVTKELERDKAVKRESELNGHIVDSFDRVQLYKYLTDHGVFMSTEISIDDVRSKARLVFDQNNST